jgi:hypothetical protein
LQGKREILKGKERIIKTTASLEVEMAAQPLDNQLVTDNGEN